MKKKRRILILVLLSGCLLFTLAAMLSSRIHPEVYISPAGSTLTVTVPSIEHGEIREDSVTLTRGTPVRLKKGGPEVSTVQYGDRTLEIATKDLAPTLAECVRTDAVYARTLVNLRKERDGALSDLTAEKGEKLKVVSADVRDLDPETGMVNWYEVEKDGQTCWIPGAYTEPDEQSVHAWDAPNVTYSDYWDTPYGAGYSKNAYVEQCDWKPVQIPDFADNPRREDVRGLHVSLANLAADPDYYLSLYDRTDLNALVVELKGESGIVAYESPAAAAWLDDGFDGMSYDALKDLIQRFKDKGFYMIARISVFKDPIFSAAYPQESIQDNAGSLLEIAGSTWASPFSRRAWEYNADLCAEAAGIFNEVQLDYTRFPEGLAQLQGQVQDQNRLGESKAAAIQHFVQYVRDRVHESHAYLSADVFAQVLTAADDQDLGQYIPAMALAADYICPMPYPDHFESGSLGIDYPWLEQGETLRRYSQVAQTVFTDGQQYRPWLQGYSNTAQEVADQIRAVSDSGYDSWMIWSGAGDPDTVEPRTAGMHTD